MSGHQVRFQDEEEILGPLLVNKEDIPQQEKAAQYYSRHELQAVLHEARDLAFAVSKQGQSSEFSYVCVMERIHRSCCEDRAPTITDLVSSVRWNRACPERRGLERFCAREMGFGSSRRIKFAIAAVLRAQERTAGRDTEERESLLKRASEAVSHPARTLARFQGIVDASVASEPKSSAAQHPEKRKQGSGSDLVSSSSSCRSNSDFMECTRRSKRRRLVGSTMILS